jgi:two-component system, sensor histidine kinase and response regulator
VSDPPAETSDGADLILRIAVPGALVRAGRVVCANEAAVSLLGERFESDLVGRNFLDIVADDAPHLVAARLRASQAGHDASRAVPALLKRTDTSPVAVEISLTPIRDATGPAVVALFPRSGWIDQRLDVLNTVNERFRELIDAAAEYVVVQDLQGRMLLANLAVQDLLGQPEAALLGRSMLDFIPEREHPAVLERAATRVTGSAGAYTYETTVIGAAGEEVRTKVASAPLLSDGRPLAVIVIGRPADDRLRDAIRLRHERDAARKASRLKSEFLAKMSHEVRTPIDAILGMMEMALDTDLPPQAREVTERARSAAFGLRSLVDDILDLSRVEAGRLDLARRKFSLRVSMAAALDPLRFLAGRRGLEVSCLVDQDVPDELIGDEFRLRQVVANLVGNGLKFTLQGRLDVRVSLAATPTPGNVHLLFAVRDTGEGIPAEQRSEIFEPFRQASAASTDAAKGTGLGLAIAREIVTLMGGQLWVESEVGRGSVFYFTATFTAVDGSATPT